MKRKTKLSTYKTTPETNKSKLNNFLEERYEKKLETRRKAGPALLVTVVLIVLFYAGS